MSFDVISGHIRGIVQYRECSERCRNDVRVYSGVVDEFQSLRCNVDLSALITPDDEHTITLIPQHFPLHFWQIIFMYVYVLINSYFCFYTTFTVYLTYYKHSPE